MIVKVVSKQLESVRVETNHCHGLTTVKKSYTTKRNSISVRSGDEQWTEIPLNAMSATYSNPSLVTSSPVHALSQSPCVIVGKGRNDSLCHLGRSKQELGMVMWSKLQQL